MMAWNDHFWAYLNLKSTDRNKQFFSNIPRMLLIVTPIVGFCNCSMFCYALLYVLSSFATVLMGKRELVALLSLSSWCLVIVLCLFLAVPWVCLQFVIVVFPDLTRILFLFADFTLFDMYFKNTKSWTRSENEKFICFSFILFVKNI